MLGMDEVRNYGETDGAILLADSELRPERPVMLGPLISYVQSVHVPRRSMPQRGRFRKGRI
jgi:hypothetical protein